MNPAAAAGPEPADQPDTTASLQHRRAPEVTVTINAVHLVDT